MKKSYILTTAATLVATVVVLCSMSSCKKRTMENMEPTGDTVEVVIDGNTVVEEDSLSHISDHNLDL